MNPAATIDRELVKVSQRDETGMQEVEKALQEDMKEKKAEKIRQYLLIKIIPTIHLQILAYLLGCLECKSI